MGKLKFSYCGCCNNYVSGEFSIVPQPDYGFFLSDRSRLPDGTEKFYPTMSAAVRQATRIQIARIRDMRTAANEMQAALR